MNVLPAKLRVVAASPQPKEKTFFLAEVFKSIQGEGALAGIPSVFIRYAGCNLRCRWCDTPHTSWSPEGRSWELDEILKHLATFPIRHAVVTGGEPFIFQNLGTLTDALSDSWYHVTIETAGTLFRQVRCDLVSLSPKLSNSTPWDREGGRHASAHEAKRINLEALRAFIRAYEYQFKVVIDQPEDVEELEQLLDRLEIDVPREKVLLMPQGAVRKELDARAAWLEPICVAEGYRFCPRLHIELFGNQKGT